MSAFTTALALSGALAPVAKGFFLMGVQNYIATERVDPIMYPGNVSNHVHTIMGGSNFGVDTNISALRDSECTSMPIAQDKSNYWFPHLYFQWANGSYTSLDAASTVYYLYGDDVDVKAFPDDFRMITGDENLRTFDNSSAAQRAISYKCLQFEGKPMEDYPGLPDVSCPAGIRAQINFPSCWDGQNVDSEDHKSHMAFPSGGPDSGTCDDPAFNVTVPRVFIEATWYTMDWDPIRDQAMNSSQPYVLSNGDSTGFSYHADYIYAWEPEVLQSAIDTCACMTDEFGAYDCCEVFEKKADGEKCYIGSVVEEQVVGTLAALPGYEPYSAAGGSSTEGASGSSASTVASTDASSASAASTDAGATSTDAGATSTVASATSPDAGATSADAGATSTDAAASSGSAVPSSAAAASESATSTGSPSATPSTAPTSALASSPNVNAASASSVASTLDAPSASELGAASASSTGPASASGTGPASASGTGGASIPGSGAASASGASLSGAASASASDTASASGIATGTASGAAPADASGAASATASGAASPSASGAATASGSGASFALLPTASTVPSIIPGPASVFTDAAPAPIMTSASDAAGASASEVAGASAGNASEATPSAYARHRRAADFVDSLHRRERFVRAKRSVLA